MYVGFVPHILPLFFVLNWGIVIYEVQGNERGTGSGTVISKPGTV